MAIQSQRVDDVIQLKAGTSAVVCRVTAPASVDTVFVYRWESPNGGTILLSLTQRGKFGSTRIVPIAVGPHGAGRVRVHGSVEAAVDVDAGGDGEFHFTILDGAVEPVPPVDTLETRVGIEDIGGPLPGPWLDVGQGWSAPERYTVGLSTTAAMDFRFVDVAGAVYSLWTVNGSALPILHPPRMRLQARQAAPSLTPTGLCAVWR